MRISKSSWDRLIRANCFLGDGGWTSPPMDFWHQNLRFFGTLSILAIVGLQYLARDFGGNPGAALEDPMVRNRVEIALRERRNTVQEFYDSPFFVGESSPTLAGEDEYTELTIRLLLFDRWLSTLRDPSARRAYISAMNSAGENCSPIWDHLLESDQDDNETGFQPKDSVEAPVGGPQTERRFPTMHKNPRSRAVTNRQCTGCSEDLYRCWNCAEPACLQSSRFPACEGHLTFRCPMPRYDPNQPSTSGTSSVYSTTFYGGNSQELSNEPSTSVNIATQIVGQQNSGIHCVMVGEHQENEQQRRGSGSGQCVSNASPQEILDATLGPSIEHSAECEDEKDA